MKRAISSVVHAARNPFIIGAESKFLTYEGLASDFYLRLTGSGAKLLRGEIAATVSTDDDVEEEIRYLIGVLTR